MLYQAKLPSGARITVDAPTIDAAHKHITAIAQDCKLHTGGLRKRSTVHRMQRLPSGRIVPA